VDDKRFLGKKPLKPDPKLRAAFFAADKQAQDLAQPQLKGNPKDANALFAMTLSMGMQADYASLIDKQQLASLKMTAKLISYAKKLLLSSQTPLMLSWSGHGELHRGEPVRTQEIFSRPRWNPRRQESRHPAARDRRRSCHYLRPFAKILLALAALRDKKDRSGPETLTELVAEFPENSLFASELAKLNVSSRELPSAFHPHPHAHDTKKINREDARGRT